MPPSLEGSGTDGDAEHSAVETENQPDMVSQKTAAAIFLTFWL